MVKYTSVAVGCFVLWLVFLVFVVTRFRTSSYNDASFDSSQNLEDGSIIHTNDISTRLDKAVIALKQLQEQNKQLKKLLDQKENDLKSVKKTYPAASCPPIAESNMHRWSFQSEVSRR